MKKGTSNKALHLSIACLAIFAIVFAANYAIHVNERPAWDAAAYLTTGQYFYGDVFLYDDIRPPVMPLFYGTLLQFTKDVDLLNIIDLALRSLACVVVFIFARKYLSNTSAFLLSLLAGISIISLRIPLFFSEFVALSFLIISMDQAIKLENEKMTTKNYILLFLFAALAILTRYPMLVYAIALSLLILIKHNKILAEKKSFTAGTIIAAIPIFLWVAWNGYLLGNPIISSIKSFTAVSNDAFAVPWHYYIWSSPENIFLMLSITIPLLLYGFYLVWKNNLRIIAFTAIISLAFITYTPAKITRYLFYFLFLSYFLILYAAEKIIEKNNKLISKHSSSILLFAVFAILMLPAIYTNPSNENWKGKEFYQNGLELKQIIPQDAIIASYYPTQIAFAAERKTYTLHDPICDYSKCPTFPYAFREIYGCEKIDFIILDSERNEACLEEYYFNTTSQLYIYKIK